MANAQFLASKIVVNEEEPSLRNIPQAATAVIGAVGIAERGPIGEATLIQSWEDYTKTFGGFTIDGDLPLAVYGIYRQDPAARLYVVRTVHYTDPATPATKTSLPASVTMIGTTATASAGAVTSANAGPFNLEPAQKLDIHVDEDVGGAETATFDAARAIAAGAGLAIVDLTGDTLILSLDGGDSQTITFAGTEATVQDVVTTINATLLGGVAVVNAGQVDIMGSIRGTDGEVDITGGTALTEIGHSVGTDSGTGDVANINAVTFAEVVAVVATDIVTKTITVTEETNSKITFTSDTTGGSSSVQVEASSDALGFGFDNLLHSGAASSSVNVMDVEGKYDGTYAEDLTPEIADATSGDADHFNLLVKNSDGLVLEIFWNVQTTDDAADDFVETVVNAEQGGSIYFEITDLASGQRPDNATGALTGGDDGLTLLDDNDFIGDSGGQTGLYALDTRSDITILVVPGRATAAMHQAMISYCETTRTGFVFAVLDPPSGYTAEQMVTYVRTTAAIKNLSEYAAIYWPEIKVRNPNTSIYGSETTVTVPPAAWVCGDYSRIDGSRPGGIYDPPAGVERGVIYGCLGFADDNILRENVRDLIYPERINPIATEEGFPRFIDGVWTLKGGGNFPSIAERRGVSFIEKSIKNEMQFARHSNNDESSRARAHRTVTAFLKRQMQAGAFQSTDPAEAYFVDFSTALNSPDIVAQYKMIGRVGLATQKPAEFILLLFSQDTRAIEEALAG